jgi:hypothetical protein
MPRGRPKTPDHLRTIPIIIRLRPELLHRLQARADVTSITRNQMIVQLLSDATTPVYTHPSDPRAAA